MKGEPILITGCSSGIGLATALELGRRGALVIATMRNLEKMEPLTRAARREDLAIEVLPLDVTRIETIEAVADRIHSRHRSLHALVNNAGYGIGGFFEDLSEKELDDQWQTNYWGVLRMIRAFLPRMREAGRGRIVNVSSTAGLAGMPGLGAYVSTKFALEGFTESLRHELTPLGIHAVLVEPGMVRSEIFTTNLRFCERGADPASPYHARAERIRRRVMERYAATAAPPEDAARVIADAIAAPSPRLRYTVTPAASMLKWMRWLLPERIFLELVAREYA